MKRGRVIAAYVLSPFAAAMYMLGLQWVSGLAPTWSDPLGIVSIIGLYAIIGYFAEGMATPIICLLRSRGYMGLRWFLLGGLVIGMFLWLFLTLYFQIFRQASLTFNLKVGLLGCIPPALISTTLFWFLGWSVDNKSLDASGGSVFRN